MNGEKSREQGKENIFEKEAEDRLKELAKDYWLKYHLSLLGKDLSVEIEIAREAYERHLERLENFSILPSPKITEIIRNVQEEARQDAKALVDEENSNLN